MRKSDITVGQVYTNGWSARSFHQRKIKEIVREVVKIDGGFVHFKTLSGQRHSNELSGWNNGLGRCLVSTFASWANGLVEKEATTNA